MSRIRSFCRLSGSVAFALLLLGSAARATEPANSPEAGPADGADATKLAEQRPETALQKDLREILEGESAHIADLQARFEAASTPLEALAVQREIDRVKQSTEVRLLQTQAIHARRSGFVQQAEGMERTAAEMAARIGIESTPAEATQR